MRKTILILVTLLVTISIIFGGCESTPEPEPAPQETPAITPAPEPTAIEVTSQELYSAYEANQVAADAKYKDKTLIVTGVVDSIGKDILDTPYITLTSGGQYAVWGVQCMFDEKHEPELAKLTKGQMVIVHGKCDGYLINVLLRDCVLIGSISIPSPTPEPTPPPEPAPPVPVPEPTPAPEPLPAQTPSVGLSRDNPLPIGESFVTPEGIEVTVVDLIEGNKAWEIIHEANMFNDPPEGGMQYVIITIKVKNISSEEEPCLVSDMDFELIGSSNKVFHSYDQSVVLPDEGSLSELWVELYHGGEETGSLSFYTPEGETNLVLIWDYSILKENKRFFEVTAPID